jgi:hypothetical protein
MGAVAYYVVAHIDDWPLFRGEQAWIDIEDPANTIVFIYMTATDGNEGDALWPAFEAGILQSYKQVNGADFQDNDQTFNGHYIKGYTSGNVLTHFLRIPIDGFMRLYQSETPAKTIDGRTTYQSVQDVTDTVRAILEVHRIAVGTDRPWVNSQDPDRIANPLDNDAHYHTGLIVQAATGTDYKNLWFIGYNITQLAPNLSALETQRKRTLFMTLSDAILTITTANGNPYNLYASNPAAYDSWMDKSYVG